MHIECKLRNMDMRNMHNTMVKVVIKVEVEALVEVLEIVEDEERLSAITTTKRDILQEFVRTLQRHVSIANILIMLLKSILLMEKIQEKRN